MTHEQDNLLIKWTDNVQCAIEDVYLFDFGNSDSDKKYPTFRQSPKVMAECLVTRRDEFMELVNDHLWQDFDNAVIYTQTAKDLVQQIGLADIFESSEMSASNLQVGSNALLKICICLSMITLT
jgi:hypothetical protein